MKKLAKIIVAASAIALLAGCKGGKSEWTEEEKKIFEDYMLYELPIYSGKNLTVSLDETNGFIVAKGSSASEDDVKKYAELLSSKDNGYVADTVVSEDLFEFYDLDKAVQLRKGDSQIIVEDVVAIGLDKKNNNALTVVMTVSYSYFGSIGMGSFFDDGYYFPADQVTYDDIIAMHDESFELANVIYDEAGNENETFKAGDFIYPASNAAWEGWGINEYTSLYPWTLGNYYGDNFLSYDEITFIAATASDLSAYVTALEAAGYALNEAATDQYPYDSYKKSLDKGDAYIEVSYEAEFFTDGTSALSVGYYYKVK